MISFVQAKRELNVIVMIIITVMTMIMVMDMLTAMERG